MTIRLECKKGEATEFCRKFDNALINLQQGETIISNFPDKLMMSIFVKDFFSELVDKNDTRTYDHQIYEGILSYTIRRVN